MFRLLVIDRPETAGDDLAQVLDAAGYEVEVARSATEGIRTALQDEFDLIFLELVLPDDSGEHVLHSVLAAKPNARIVIASNVDEPGRRAGALDMGAVDFVPKPFVGVELLARVRARLRGRGAWAVPQLPTETSAQQPVLARSVDGAPDEVAERRERAGALVVDARPTHATVGATALIDHPDFRVDMLRRVLVVDGRCVELSQREFLLMCHLLRRRGEVCTRRELLAHVWGIDFDARTNVVDVYIGRLRSKLAIDTIDTVRNVGYRLSVA